MSLEEKLRITNERLKTLRLNKEEKEVITSKPKPSDYTQDRIEQIDEISKKLENIRSQSVNTVKGEEIRNFEVRI